jgi:hypothetical protein
MSPLPSLQLRDYGIVSTIHILQSGEVISSVEEYLKVEERFSWVDRAYIVSKILHLRKLTDDHKRSVIVIYEDGHLIREFVRLINIYHRLFQSNNLQGPESKSGVPHRGGVVFACCLH